MFYIRDLIGIIVQLGGGALVYVRQRFDPDECGADGAVVALDRGPGGLQPVQSHGERRELERIDSLPEPRAQHCDLVIEFADRRMQRAE